MNTKQEIESLFFMKHIEDFMLMYPDHEGSVSINDLHKFLNMLNSNNKFRQALKDRKKYDSIIKHYSKDVEFVCKEVGYFPVLPKVRKSKWKFTKTDISFKT
ncbi:hypothetical protein QZN10_39720 [Burkholderia contaminans]|jgi:hypothetical protein|uniref:hypothetical protein n=1 Tax=Burkholderia contaminans TaxID=488447 RepID=UPI000AFD6B5F|nr:hypothetical protein [Burkholderia contaminans]MDN8026751.1 hypothetical protein [Burkholderia contaminans]